MKIILVAAEIIYILSLVAGKSGRANALPALWAAPALTQSRKRKREVEAEEPENRKQMQKVAKLPMGVCVKVASLRPRYNDLEKWCINPRHTLVTRHGRVFIGKGDKKHVFSYPSSDWANPFKVKEHGPEKSLELFDEYLTEKISDSAELKKFLQLCNYDEIG